MVQHGGIVSMMENTFDYLMWPGYFFGTGYQGGSGMVPTQCR